MYRFLLLTLRVQAATPPPNTTKCAKNAFKKSVRSFTTFTQAWFGYGSSKRRPTQADPFIAVTLSRSTPRLAKASMSEQGVWVNRRSTS
jgi:hypothetical protein